MTTLKRTICEYSGRLEVSSPWDLGGRGLPTLIIPLREERCWRPKNMLLPICVITPNFVALRQTVWAAQIFGQYFIVLVPCTNTASPLSSLVTNSTKPAFWTVCYKTKYRIIALLSHPAALQAVLYLEAAVWCPWPPVFHPPSAPSRSPYCAPEPAAPRRSSNNPLFWSACVWSRVKRISNYTITASPSQACRPPSRTQQFSPPHKRLKLAIVRRRRSLQIGSESRWFSADLTARNSARNPAKFTPHRRRLC